MDFLYEFGSYGKEAGMFREPRALAVDDLGYVYVADSRNDRIEVFGPSGDFLFQWGGGGSRPGEFDIPSGIAAGKEKIFVADTDNNRIQIFDKKGNYIDSFGRRGDAPKEFRKPRAIGHWNGLLYVADTGNSRIQVFSEDGIFLYQMNPRNSKYWNFEDPFAISLDQNGRIYFLEEGGRLKTIDQNGKVLVSPISKGEAIIAGAGGLYLAKKNRVYKFDSSFREIMSSGADGERPGMFKEISALGVNALNNLYVLDAGKNTVQVFQTEIEKADTRPADIPSSVAFYKDIPANSDLILLNKKNVVLAFDGDKERFFPMNGESRSSTSNRNNLSDTNAAGNSWVVNKERHCLQKFAADGKLILSTGEKGSRDGQFYNPSHIEINKNTIYVADSGNARIQLFDANGNYISSFGRSGKGPGELRKPVALAFDKKNNLYVLDEDLNKVVKTDSSGNFIMEFGSEGKEDGKFAEPKGIAVINEEIYVLDSGNHRVQVFSSNGEYRRKFGSEGKGKGEFKEPSSLASDDDYNLYIFDKGNSRVQILKLLLTPSRPDLLKAEGLIKEVGITWSPNPEPHVAYYKIFRRKKDEQEFEEIARVNKASYSKYSYFDKKLESDATFYYSVVAVSKTGNSSGMSNIMKATTRRLIPSAPKLIKTETGQRDVFIEWMPSPELYTDHYILMRNDDNWRSFREIDITKGTSYTDKDLNPNTLYKYMLVAVSTEGDRSEPLGLEATTLKLPAIEVKGTEVEDIFSNNYKYYELNPFGKIRIKNNSDNALGKLKISLMVQDYMDYPSEMIIENIESGKTEEVPLKAVFNNKLLDLTENSTIQSEITVSYLEDKESRTVSLSVPLKIFEKHALIWNKTEKASIFITPKDPLFLDLAIKYVSGYNDVPLNRPLLRARSVFEALGVLGLSYMENPNNPYQVVSQNVSLVDYVQYPRETLKRKAGDCVDLVALYSSLLESIGISTAFVTYPGHIFMMFDTGVGGEDFGFPPDDYIIFKKTAWVPVEATLVGSSFDTAWKKGLDEIQEWKGKGLGIVDLRDAWQNFKPPTLQYDDWQPEMIRNSKIEETFPNEIEAFKQRRINYLKSVFLDASDASYGIEQLGILYGENSRFQEAMDMMDKYINLNGEDASVLNNIGNIYFLRKDYRNAEKAYLKALKYDPQDVGILVNCARYYYNTGKKDKARKYFNAALEIDPEVDKKYFYLASELRR